MKVMTLYDKMRQDVTRVMTRVMTSAWCIWCIWCGADVTSGNGVRGVCLLLRSQGFGLRNSF